jgi:hypothetical protein
VKSEIYHFPSLFPLLGNGKIPIFVEGQEEAQSLLNCGTYVHGLEATYVPRHGTRHGDTISRLQSLQDAFPQDSAVQALQH